MKFTAVAIILALAMSANASILGPLVLGGHWPGAVVVGPAGPAAITVAATPAVVAGPGPVQVVSGPAVVPAVLPAPVVVGGGTFVAKTRGAVHVAPLEGHTQSVVSANLEPAPGTI